MPATVEARLVDRVRLSDDICAFTFETGQRLDDLEPGAHVDLHLSPDRVRSYSLTDWDDTGRRLSVAVKAEPEGRGGSLAVHRLTIGAVVPITRPRNNFALTRTDLPVVLLGGGIGITPLIAMATALERDIDHRDSILTDEEKAAGDCLCACVSRAAGPRLVLDL